VSAETEIMEEFTNTRSARRRISLAEDLLAASIKEEAKPSLAQVLSGITEAVRDSNQLDAAERLYGAFVRDELARILGHDISSVTPNQSELIKESVASPPSPRKSRSTSSRASWNSSRKPTRWSGAKSSSPPQDFAGQVHHRVHQFPHRERPVDELAAALKRWKTEQNLRAPVLLWVIKNRTRRNSRSS